MEVEIEYVPSHRYYVAFWVVADDGSTVNYKLLDTVGHGSSETGYNMLQKRHADFACQRTNVYPDRYKRDWVIVTKPIGKTLLCR